MKKITSQHGFTLLELMIAIVLGLIIVAAGVQLFITGTRSVSLQKGVADIQSNGSFGLNFMLRDIALANLDGGSTTLTDRTTNGGVVLTSYAAPSLNSAATTAGYTATTVPINIPSTITTTQPLTSSAVNASNVLVSSSVQKSDQLVIQFYAPVAGYDCEGNAYTAGQYIVQRYFLRTDTTASSTEPNTALALACEAGYYSASSPTAIYHSGSTSVLFGATTGQILIHRVDQFHFLLGVSDSTHTGSFRYMTVADYLALTTYPRPRINSIKIGMLLRSTESVGTESLITDGTDTFQLFDQTLTMPVSTATAKYLRRIVEQTIALRNGTCMTDSTSSSATCS